MSRNPPCVKCELTDNSNGLFTCNGCRRSFCANHIADHSNELRNRFENITNEYNLINDRFRAYQQTSNDHRCITIGNGINTIKFELDRSQKSANYCERDLDEWTERLRKLQVHLTNTNETESFLYKLNRIFSSTGFRIYLSLILLLITSYYINVALLSTISFSRAKFIDPKGPILLLPSDRVAEHNGPDYLPAAVRVDQIYTRDVHYVRFAMEKLLPSTTFIGIATSKDEQSVTRSHGWFLGDEQTISHQLGEYQIVRALRTIWSMVSGNQPRHSYRCGIKQGDTIEIVIDCANSKLILTNKRTKMSEELDVDQKQNPLPWQIWISFDRHGDRVRLQ